MLDLYERSVLGGVSDTLAAGRQAGGGGDRECGSKSTRRLRVCRGVISGSFGVSRTVCSVGEEPSWPGRGSGTDDAIRQLSAAEDPTSVAATRGPARVEG